MKNPNPVNLQTSAEIRDRGWQAESRDADGHLISCHAPIAADDPGIAEWIVECTSRGETVTFWPTNGEVAATQPPPPSSHVAPSRQARVDVDTLALETVRELSSHLRLSDIQHDGQMTAKWQVIVARALARMVVTPSLDWLNMADAPKDGTMLRLLVVPDQEEFTAFDDSLTPYETIGSNNCENTGEDRWEFAGWDWQQDCFITGRGEVVGWASMSIVPDGSAAPTPPKTHLAVEERAENLARHIWGYFKGDSAGGSTAMQWFDNHKHMGGPAHIIGLCRAALATTEGK